MAAAAEKPFMMLSVYFTTTEVYRPPTLARTGGYRRGGEGANKTQGQQLYEREGMDRDFLKHVPACVVGHLHTTKHTQGV